MNKEYDLVIIGGGSAGMALAIEAYNLGIKNLIILEKNNYLGGILNQCIHSGFGLGEFKEELTGPEFMIRFSDKVNELNIPYLLNTTVTDITKDKEIYFTNENEFNCIKAKALVITTGCYERNAGAIMLPGDRPQGVYTAGTAQYYLNIENRLVGKNVFILGSGDIGLIMARRFTLEGANVLGVAEICPYSNGLNRNMVQCLYDFNIPLYLSHTVSKVTAENGKLKSITISHLDDNRQIIPNEDKTFECDTLLLSVGLIPNTTLLQHIGVNLTRTKGPIINERYETNVSGIFTCGNALHVHDLVDKVTIESRNVAHFIKDYLNNPIEDNNYIETIAGDGIGYVLPHKIHSNFNNDVTLKFRCKTPLKECYLIVSSADKELKKVFRPYLIPSEMGEITLSKDQIKECKNNVILKVVAK